MTPFEFLGAWLSGALFGGSVAALLLLRRERKFHARLNRLLAPLVRAYTPERVYLSDAARRESLRLEPSRARLGSREEWMEWTREVFRDEPRRPCAFGEDQLKALREMPGPGAPIVAQTAVITPFGTFDLVERP